MSKRKKKSPLEKLQDECEQAWKDYIVARDGEKCMVREYNSSFPLSHTDVMQADHCFSRTDKNLFLDPANGTCICSACNMLKGFGQRGIDYIVHQIVINREGKAKHDDMMFVHQCKNPSKTWKDFIWLENQLKMLKELKAAL